MTVYPLMSLARVRQLREENAVMEYSASEKALLAAREETLARRKALEEHLLWREEEEDRRYREILDKELSRKEMDEFKAGVAALREKDAILLEALEEARKAEEEAARHRDEAAETLKRRRKEMEKIDTHQEIWQTGEAIAAERREDLEMEEFTGLKRPEMHEDSDD